MAKELHTVSLLKGTVLAQEDRVLLGMQVAVANAAGGGAGAAVVTAVAFAGDLPAKYSVFVNPGQDATWFVSGKTATGFNVTLNPRLAANTLAAGTIDVLVVA